MRLFTIASVKSALWAALLVFPLLANAGFSPNGAEVAKPGHLRGDQTLPQAAIDHTGGFLVWQDNNADTSGLGIKAQRLDSGLEKVGAAFRVNLQPANDQEKPQVSLLRNGGAVFVWQGGPAGAQRIYARFLGANGAFVSSDVRVNTYVNGFQADPAVATLADGSVIVTWSSYDQDGSMQGIYAQRLSPRGVKLGGEFRVNQTTLYNQRSPVVAGLTNGNYVVVWVSELQRNSASVDIFARIFKADGTPVTPNEFPINLSSANVGANPSVSASLLTGGFAVAWSQDDNRRLAAGNSAGGAVVTNAAVFSTKSWDVFARLYGPAGNAVSGEIAVNTTTYGDQYAPVIRAFGEEYGVLWTSLGQDSSREGVYGQFLNSDGSLAGSEFRVNTTTISRQFQPVLASDNHAQVVAFWSSFNGGGTGFDLFSQRFGADQVIPLERIANSLPPIEEPNTGLPRLDVPDEAAFAEPVANGLALAAGTYHGLFFDKYGVNGATSGYLTVKTTAKGAYSGKLLLGGASYSLKGSLDDSGWAASVINRKGNTPLNVYLQVDLSGGDSLRGGVSDGDWWSDLQGDRQVFSKSNPTPTAGSYTLLIRGGGSGPLGDGVGTLRVDASGALKFTGTLADGTKVTQKSILTKEGYWPLYANLYKGGGALLGWLKFENEINSDIGGTVVWSKRADPLAPRYPAGFVSSSEVTGSRYVAPTPGQKILNLEAGQLAFSGGTLPANLALPLTLNANGAVSGDASLKLSFSKTQGTFKGSAAPGGVPVSFQGVVLQKANHGGGYFLNANQSGQVKLNAVP